mmetsp:Transcript_18976/g.38460  ORF Transcript_18976/g.38460 Transcript_18976/m.38460 type:complete len:107 (-) Transcript_18976:554-874(-)|eukprot:CAMPEP_0183298600 /NCGR_PEP_ID=MMETSP0160_2-20130417/5563_1 /TAXON_ID=2839 ORGANISM="Odontella Sinensis, Strain Grunow 1884" /NCGR_SAMPLE_ID=MMETSP0160_2 /ASSEMBLY_ACC=CAM_ASM_000250 /LENGTH=106 /DNA_ID=CAMNT_0025460673 /DNA_START=137 /DNA_END=457 /DNA_ORIENTATION=-
MVKFVETEDEWNALMEESKSRLIVIDFTASWCGPCRFVAPHFEKLAAEKPDVTFVKIDVDEADVLAQRCGIQAMPTFQFYRNGTKIAECRGADINQLNALVAKHSS